MNERKSFNLWDEKWICILNQDCEIQLVSLFELFKDAHNYKSLAGETETQNAAMIRFLLSILHTVFSRMDENGNETPLSLRNSRSRWKKLWDLGHFPMIPIVNYYKKWKNRFDLFDNEHPFYQVPQSAIESDKYTELKASKLNGEFAESNHQSRFFLGRTGKNKEQLSLAEASRWLIHLQSYDDRGKQSINWMLGWLGNLGFIYAVGDNLFQTLMLNLIFLRDGRELWGECKPTWENEKVRVCTDKENSLIVFPDNPAELYSIQTRRIRLNINADGYIDKFYSKGGDYFNITANNDSNLILNEQMTLFAQRKEEETNIITPRKHDKSVQIWREFASIVSQININDRDNLLTPGIIKWISIIQPLIGKDKFIHFFTVGIEYKRNSAIAEIFSDSLNIHTKLLKDAWSIDRKRIIKEIERIEKIADKAMQNLSDNLVFSCGIEDNRKSRDKEDKKDTGYRKLKSERDKWKRMFYFNLDIPFRIWLDNYVDKKEEGNIEDFLSSWREKSKQIARSVCDEMIFQFGKTAMIGHKFPKDDKKKDWHIRAEREKWYSSAQAKEDFEKDLHFIEKEYKI